MKPHRLSLVVAFSESSPVCLYIGEDRGKAREVAAQAHSELVAIYDFPQMTSRKLFTPEQVAEFKGGKKVAKAKAE